MMEIKKAVESDAAEIADLLTQLGYPASEEFVLGKIRELTGHPDGELVIACEDGKVVGFISFHFIPQLALLGSFARISYLCVDEKVRGRGIGSQLESYAERAARARGCDRVELHCHSRRGEAHKFYARQGYLESPKYFIKKFL